MDFLQYKEDFFSNVDLKFCVDVHIKTLFPLYWDNIRILGVFPAQTEDCRDHEKIGKYNSQYNIARNISIEMHESPQTYNVNCRS